MTRLNRLPTLQIVLMAIITLLIVSRSNVQAQSTTWGWTPPGVAPGAPAGSYPLNNFENINVYNGHLSITLPLLSVGGRGEAGYTIPLTVAKHPWIIESQMGYWYDCTNEPCEYHYYWMHFANPYPPDYLGGPLYTPGVMTIRRSGEFVDCLNRDNWGNCVSEFYYINTLSKLIFTLADGTELEFIDQDTEGAVKGYTAGSGYNRGSVWNTRDGGISATFIFDNPQAGAPLAATDLGLDFQPPLSNDLSGDLYLKSGLHYRINSGGGVDWIEDRNGNRVRFEPYGTNGFKAIDSMNREVTVSRGVDDGYPYGVCDRITYKGFNGTQRTIRVSKALMGDVLRSGYSLQTYHQLFPELFGSSLFNPSVASSLWLPDGRRYQFKYNSYGEVAQVELPTGGGYQYDYGRGNPSGPSSGLIGAACYWYCPAQLGEIPRLGIYRRLWERREYTDMQGLVLAGKTTYDMPTVTGGGLEFTNTIETVRNYDAGGNLLNGSKHYFYFDPISSILFDDLAQPFSPRPYNDGKEFKVESLNAAGGVVTRVENTWSPGALPGGPRITDVTTTLLDTNQVSKVHLEYDIYSNVTVQQEYDFGNGTPGPEIRRTVTSYVGTNPVNGAVYNNPYPVDFYLPIIHLRNLVGQASVFQGSIERSRTTVEFDNYNSDANHSPLKDWSTLTGVAMSGTNTALTTAYTKRGNATSAASFLLDTSGNVIGSVSSYAQYDLAGNVVKQIDSNGNETVLDFRDRFGAPNGEAQANSSSAELSAANRAAYAFPTKLTNAKGHISYTQFDYYLGRAVDAEDPNNVVSSVYFDDPLDRPSKAIGAANQGASVKAQVRFDYDDTNRTITTRKDQSTFDDPDPIKTQIVYDRLGRTVEKRQYETAGTFIAVQTQYDALGRTFKISNPYHPGDTVVWTTTTYDALNRVKTVTYPDNAVVSSDYFGNSVTVTDPANKKRKSIMDAVGRLTQVYEDPTGLNYETTYNYDVRDNLVKVTQGSQQRFFMYDSLRRVIRARLPEQGTNAALNVSDPISGNSAWSIGYQYDSNGNLRFKTDARGIVTETRYDVLNRITTILYRLNGQPDPNTGDVEYLYDNATNGKGRLWLTYKWDAKPSHTAVGQYDAMGRVTQFYNLFGDGVGGWSPGFAINRTYNLAGNVTSQSYPSGHTATYSYDPAGRASSFSGNLGDGASRNYATNISYSTFGWISREQFGTNTPLYHKSFYNIRGQLFDTRVSSLNDTWDWNRGRLILYYSSNHLWGQSGTDNNGTVRFAETWIPPENATLDQTHTLMEDSYNYDGANRLTSVVEQRISVDNGWVWQQQFRQQYAYDRWGNRTIDAGQTWGVGINNRQFTVDTATNRLGVPGGQPGIMSYDNGGNLTTDTYTGSGSRTYDAENRIVSAADNFNQVSRYVFNANGKRVRQQVASSQERWQVYGIDGELLAEYRASTPTSVPEKEYGYRNGQLLVTATGRLNMALAANGAVATASTAHTCCGFSTTGAINGNNRGPWGNGEGWNDATPDTVPDWIQVDFAGSKTIDEINVFSLHDNYTQENTPTETQTFSLYGLLAFDVQYWNGSSWTTIPGGSVTGNNKVWRKFTFAAITTNKIRVWINTVPDSWSRVVEIQAYGTSAGGEKVQWLVSDHLGTPRMVIDQTGTLANIRRHDYLPFGEELFAGAGGRTATLGYAGGDAVRQQFTSKERDIETGLDYFGVRYLSSVQGRFTSPDPLLSSGRPNAPQTWNRYSYVSNNPLNLIDPFGAWEWGANLGGNAKDEDVSAEILARRNAIRAALAQLKAKAQAGNLSAREAAKLLRAVTAYGREGDRGVTIDVGTPRHGQGEAGNLYRRQEDGTLTITSTVVLSASSFTDNFENGVESTLAHEGDHIAGGQEFVFSWNLALYDRDSGARQRYEKALQSLAASNQTKLDSELSAYTVTSIFFQASDFPSPARIVGVSIYRPEWTPLSEAERSSNRTTGIEEALRISTAYGLTRGTNEGRRRSDYINW